MTTDLEKQFFDTFGIEPKTIIEPRYSLNTEYYEEKVEKYPKITDTHYIQLICWVNERRIFQNFDVNGLKEYVLKELCTMVVTDKFKHQVRALFKEER